MGSLSIEDQRTVRVLGIDGEKHALELTRVNDAVKVSPLPRNSGSRQMVTLEDLKAAVDAL